MATTVLGLVLGLGAFLAPAASAAAGPTGIDISRWQHPNGRGIDWTAVRRAGHDFAIVKATESTDYVNPYYAGDVADARAVGMIVGAYDFARPSRPVVSDAAAEARHFLATVGASHQPGTLPPILDLEQSGGLSDAELIAWTHAWLDTVHAATGRQGIIYTYRNFWSGHMAGTAEFGGYPLWLAAYTSTLDTLIGNWPAWTLWQYSSGGSVPGIAGRVDVNRFNGSLADLAALANGAALPAAAPTSPFPPANVVATPGDGTARLSWVRAPSSGAPVTSYTVTLQPGGTTQTLPASATSVRFTGLTNGRRYVVTITATNALGTSDPLAATVTPNVQTTIALTSSAGAVAYGSSVSISARLTRNDGSPLAGRTVVLDGRTAASGGFAPIATVTTDANGRVSASLTPHVSVTYRLRYAGAADGPSTASSVVLVRPLVSGRLDRVVARVGWKLTMTGTVRPLASVFIYRQQLVSGRWTTLDRAAVTRTGGYLFRVVPVRTGVKTYRLLIPQSARFGTATSDVIRLIVR